MYTHARCESVNTKKNKNNYISVDLFYFYIAVTRRVEESLKNYGKVIKISRVNQIAKNN